MISDLIVVAERRPWTPSCTFQLMCRLLLDRQILWVDANAFRREHSAAGAPPARTADSGGVPFPVLTAEDLGVGTHPLARFVGPRLLVTRIMRVARSHRLRQPILWLASPAGAPLLEGGYDGPVVYQMSGERPPAEPDAARAFAAREASILARADLVVAPSRAWTQHLGSTPVRLLPPAAAVDLFSTPAQPARDLPSGGPVAGCHGHFDDAFDAELFAGVARRLPAWRFMLLGPVSCDLSALHRLSNVHIAGARPQDQLPRYLQFWDAALLPRHQRSLMPRTPALPFLESLAAGLPVVVAGKANLGGYADMVRRVTDPDAAAAALAAAVAEPVERRVLRRRRVAGDGWGARAALVNRLLAGFDAQPAVGAIAGGA
jgi:hypothetical protein